MPRSRRRHHSRSKSRSRSHSHERDRDVKRRRLDPYDSPLHHRRSVSSEPDIKYEDTEDVEKDQSISSDEADSAKKLETENVTDDKRDTESSEEPMESSSIQDQSLVEESEKPTSCVTPSSKASDSKILDVTPKKTMSPRQHQKHMESEKKRRQKQLEREEKERKRQEEKEEKLRLKQELQKQKQEKEEQKKKEKEEKERQKKKEREEKELQKKKEKEEKEQKRKEKEEKEEQRRKEKEQERLKKLQEIEEKNKEKQRQEEQKQKAAAVFANFFVPLKTESEEKKPVEQSAFMPFEVKSDMKLAPIFRNELTEAEKEVLTQAVNKQDDSTETYLRELKKGGRKPRKSEKTWPYVDSSEDVIFVGEDATLGESVCEQKPKMEKMRVKFLKFHANRRPPYYGTWRKKSETIGPRRPLVEDKVHFDYEVDSDDDWEEEEQGESITGSDGEDKENESDDYEVDNEFFVPHGHLSEDEVDDEETNRLSPEAHKAKLKLLKNEFDEEMKSKTQKFKPRVIGCIWYTKDGKVDEAIDRFLQPLAIITNKPIVIKKRSDPSFQSGHKKRDVPSIMDSKLIPTFLELIHGSTKKRKDLVKEFVVYLEGKPVENAPSKSLISRSLKQLAQWVKCPEEGPLLDKNCWYVNDEVREKHGVKLDLPNKWKFITKEDGAL